MIDWNDHYFETTNKQRPVGLDVNDYTTPKDLEKFSKPVSYEKAPT